MKPLPVFSHLVLCAALALPLSATPSSETNNQKAAEQMNLSVFVLPDFPGYLTQLGITEGSVAVAIGRTASGEVNDVLVLDSTDERFSAAVVDAVRKWRFAPPVAGAAAVAPTIPLVRFQFYMGGAASVLMPTIYAGKSDLPTRIDEIQLTTFDELDREPAARAQPMPQFPAALRQRGVSGEVSVSFFVDADGQVRVPLVTAAESSELADVALAAIRQWRFDAPQRKGRPVNALDTRTFNFGAASRRDS